eukprot:CAMPEP_0174839050 /NCGR_PEP_ID=MMETSP1114-20130205/7803_1 /TAXON_ID=312471 /ORGANISM="Neobodo designis, Strain CCAP 1951/1" /LENGTH=56 /DNA_ID=CAMNT_0016073171 /DNA_START=35 /DNA_END=201 /DNA_ORIENTATION=+
MMRRRPRCSCGETTAVSAATRVATVTIGYDTVTKASAAAHDAITSRASWFGARPDA